jgi:hypothetical protein
MECVRFELDLDLFPRRIVSLEDGDSIRTPGLHLTDIIKDIMLESGMSQSVSGASWGENQLWMAGEIGFMWEEILSSALKSRLPNRIGEMFLEGVYMSPDGIDVEECKGYCYGVGVEQVKMAILYLNGDWKGSGPEYRGYHIRFTPLEIQENWEMILGHARRKGWL